MKHTILIADDESLDRKGMELILRHNFPEAEIKADIANGLQLLEAAQEASPDLIIADIEMPGMTGLEALNRLAEQGCTASVIIMTAYGSYQYAKESLALRVFAYLEKPARREKIVQTVEAALQEIEKNRSLSEEMDGLRAYIERMRPALISEWMTGIETDKADSKQLNETAQMLGIGEDGGFILTCRVQGETAGTPLQQSVARLRVFEALRNLMDAEGWIAGHVINQTLACFVPQFAERTAYQDMVAAMEKANRLYSALSPECRRAVQIGVGSRREAPEQMDASYRESLRALCVRDSISPIRHFDDVAQGQAAQDPFSRIEFQLADSVCRGDKAACENLIRKAFGGFALGTGMDTIRDSIVVSMLNLRRLLVEVIPEERINECLPPVLRERLMAAPNVLALEELYDCTCERLIECVRNQQKSRVTSIVDQAEQYVSRHYMDDISLESTAEVIGVSQYYLSRLFKAERNVNFSAYLTELRVRKACTYLDGSDLSVREIAERTGFNNPDYFGKVFKRLMGCTVSEYRAKR